MRRIVGGALALLVLLPAVRALDEPKPPGTPAEQYKALAAEYQKGLDDYMKAAREAKTNEERVRAFQKRPYPEKFAARDKAIRPSPPCVHGASRGPISADEPRSSVGCDGPRQRRGGPRRRY